MPKIVAVEELSKHENLKILRKLDNMQLASSLQVYDQLKGMSEQKKETVQHLKKQPQPLERFPRCITLPNESSCCQSGQCNSSSSIVEVSLQPQIPNDKCNFVYTTFFLFGMASVLPWCMFTSASDFFVNYKFNTPISRGSFYQKNFLLINKLIWQCAFLVAILFNLLNCNKRFNPTIRIPFALATSTLSMAALVTLCVVNSRDWSDSLFICLCLLNCVISAMSGVIFSSAFYYAASFPMRNTNSILIGYNLSGLFACVIALVNKSVAVNINSAMAGVFFLVLTFGLLIVTFAAHFSLRVSSFHRHFTQIARQNQALCAKLNGRAHEMSYWRTLQLIWPFLLLLWLNVFAMSAIYPAYQEKIQPSATASFFISNDWFTDITCHMTHRVMLCLGNLTALLFRWPGPRLVLLIALVNATLTVSFFVTCNYSSGERNAVPVYINNDFLYSAGAILWPYLHGHLVSLLVMYTPKQVKNKYARSAALLVALTLPAALVVGSYFSATLEHLVLY